MNSPLRYPTPWDLVAGLSPYIWRGERRGVDDFTSRVLERIRPVPAVEGLWRLPADPRFVLVANHYQRKGLWILHAASVLTQLVRERYGEGDPPVRWVTTASFPRWRCCGWSFRSPGDWVLPRVARALDCWPVAFHGADPGFTARTVRRLLGEARTLTRPIGLFPEGASATADCPGPPLPGVGRLLKMLAARGMPVVPAGISEAGRFVVSFGDAIPAAEIVRSPEPGFLVMDEVRRLARQVHRME